MHFKNKACLVDYKICLTIEIYIYNFFKDNISLKAFPSFSFFKICLKYQEIVPQTQRGNQSSNLLSRVIFNDFNKFPELSKTDFEKYLQRCTLGDKDQFLFSL